MPDHHPNTLDSAAISGGDVFASTDLSSVEKRFHRLVAEWKDATRFVSSIHDMVCQPAYLQIIGMGKDALPLLVNELRREPDHWFVALQAITGANPIPPAVQGDVEEMTRAWLSWAEKNKL